MNCNFGEIIVTAKNRNTRRENSSSANLFTRNPTWTAMVSRLRLTACPNTFFFSICELYVCMHRPVI